MKRSAISYRHWRYVVEYPSDIPALGLAFDLAFGSRAYETAPKAFGRAPGVIRDWRVGGQIVPTRFLTLLIRRLEAGGIIEQELRAKIALAEAEAGMRRAALVPVLEALKRDREERRSWPDKRRGRMKPHKKPVRKAVKALSEPVTKDA